MDTKREDLLKKGWTSLGFDGHLEYFAKEDEHGAILFIPVYNGVTIGYVRSESSNVINLLHGFVSK